LHLRNIVLVWGEPRLFDAIEFSDEIATGDVLYDLAFLLMDFWERDLRQPANLLLNRYLWDSAAAHLSGLAALPTFLSLRAAIRAKVAASAIPHLGAEQREPAAAGARRYFDFAESFLKPAPLALVAVGGLSGSGKSTLAAAMAPHLERAPGAVHLRSDIERKRLFGVGETERLPAEAYATSVTERIYRRLRRKAALAINAGQSVVVDALHARPEERDAIENLARRLQAPFVGLWLEAPHAVLIDRVRSRSADASDADAAIVALQEGYDPGAIAWPRLDTSTDLASLLTASLRFAPGRETSVRTVSRSDYRM
jgi:predicted kinase